MKKTNSCTAKQFLQRSKGKKVVILWIYSGELVTYIEVAKQSIYNLMILKNSPAMLYTETQSSFYVDEIL